MASAVFADALPLHAAAAPYDKRERVVHIGRHVLHDTIRTNMATNERVSARASVFVLAASIDETNERKMVDFHDSVKISSYGFD